MFGGGKKFELGKTAFTNVLPCFTNGIKTNENVHAQDNNRIGKHAIGKRIVQKTPDAHTTCF
jgi:hypothetical protein